MKAEVPIPQDLTHRIKSDQSQNELYKSTTQLLKLENRPRVPVFFN